MDLWSIVAEELQLSYRVVTPPSGGFGALLENGTWSGIIGELDAKVSGNTHCHTTTPDAVIFQPRLL